MSEQHDARLPPSDFDGITPLQRPKQDVSCEISDVEGWISNAQRIEVDDAAESTVEQHIAIVQVTMHQRASSAIFRLWKFDGDPPILLDAEGYLADSEKLGEHRYQIRLHSCAIWPVARQYGQACNAELDFICDLIPGATVERTTHKAAGAHTCTYDIRTQH